jgi:hypothetical protein
MQVKGLNIVLDRLSGNTETMQMLELLECQENKKHDLPANVRHLPHPPSQPSYLMPTPRQPPSSSHRTFKIPSLQERPALVPLRVLFRWPKVPLRSPLPNKGLLLMKVIDSFSLCLFSTSLSFQYWFKQSTKINHIKTHI